MEEKELNAWNNYNNNDDIYPSRHIQFIGYTINKQKKLTEKIFFLEYIFGLDFELFDI